MVALPFINPLVSFAATPPLQGGELFVFIKRASAPLLSKEGQFCQKQNGVVLTQVISPSPRSPQNHQLQLYLRALHLQI